MAWSTSNRRASLPKDWHQRRARAWRAASGQCQWVTAGTRCGWTGRLIGDRGQVDHIDRAGGDDPTNLQWLCPHHHTVKTQAEARTARPRRALIAPEDHPNHRRGGWGGVPP